MSRGFSLIDLLCVIGIIAVLLALLFPALARARAQARQIVCLSALRQYALANQMYLNEYHDWYVPLKMGWSQTAANWPQLPTPKVAPSMPLRAWTENWGYRRLLGVHPDTPERRVPAGLVCPDAVMSQNTANSWGLRAETSYGYNSGTLAFADPAAAPAYMEGFKRGQIRNAAEKLMFADATDWAINMWCSPNYPQFGERYGPPPFTNMTAYRHRNGANVAFFDGHGAWLSAEQIIYDRTTGQNRALWDTNQ